MTTTQSLGDEVVGAIREAGRGFNDLHNYPCSSHIFINVCLKLNFYQKFGKQIESSLSGSHSNWRDQLLKEKLTFVLLHLPPMA